MSLTAENPRAVPGDNSADHAQIVIDRLASEYAEIQRSVAAGLEEARGLPASVDDEDTQSRYAAVIKNLRDLDGRLEGVRVSEKEPYLRSGTAVDSFFGALKAKLFRKNKNDKAGAADVLQARVNDYVARKEAAERAERARILREAQAQESAAKAERDALEKAAQESAAAAARARNPEKIEEHLQTAAVAQERAAEVAATVETATANRRIAEADALAKPADLVRTRTDGGHMVTARQVPYVEITDRMQLDFEQLKPFFKDDAVLAALKAWCKVTQHKKQMPGAIIELRSEAIIR